MVRKAMSKSTVTNTTGTNGAIGSLGPLKFTLAEKIVRRPKKNVDGYGSPCGLFKLIKYLTPEQSQSIEEIGFGGFLKIKTNGFYHLMVDFLMNCYDPISRLFRISERQYFVVSKHDMYDVFMLPCVEGSPVMTMSTKRKDNPDTCLMDMWRSKLGVGPGEEVPLENLYLKMVKMRSGGDEFKQLFVLYAMWTFLAPTSHKHVDFRLVKAVESADNIVKQDWCTYVIERLNYSVTSWKAKNTKHVGECLMFLQLVYFHRLCWRGVEVSSTIPLVQHWTYDSIKLREREAAVKNGGSYGMGEWDKKTYPVSRYHRKRLYMAATESNVEDEDTITFTFKKPTDLLTDAQITAKYKEVIFLFFYSKSFNNGNKNIVLLSQNKSSRG
ncbi:hypothetical protein RND81_12G021900 [Saponaria officinalis]|uniref:Aminotransferase-like plant mobile domain-containing protein n=1 Tax=Saponaria officinalis TaxID=3572 RepID=A0AAW1H4A6_SAPOF